MKLTIIFDMDGTIANLYAVDDWLSLLRAYSSAPYQQAKAMWDMEQLGEVLQTIISAGNEVKVCSWLSRETTKDYDRAVRQAKREWLSEHDFPFTHCHLIPYGKNKGYYRDKDSLNILIDDNALVREQFCKFANCEAVDPTQIDIIEYLKGLVQEDD